ncbi:MAG: hypothetical protein R3F35_15605 [Myxococcota bacterium]
MGTQVVACGTMVHGTRQEVRLESDPPGAQVTVEPSGIEVVTPGAVELERERDQLLTFELDGHGPRARQVNRQISGIFFLNLLLGGLPGMVVDLASGGAYDLEPATTMTLKPKLTAEGVR